jgi:hypothetical protein
MALIGPVSGLINKVLDKTCEDKDLKQKLKAEALTQLMTQDHSEFTTHLKESASIIRAEANSQSWLARNWRPMLMCLFGLIIANNYIIFPYMNMFMPEKSVLLPVPVHLWDLLKLGIGGYVVGRSGEKIVKVWKDKKVE